MQYRAYIFFFSSYIVSVGVEIFSPKVRYTYRKAKLTFMLHWSRSRYICCCNLAGSGTPLANTIAEFRSSFIFPGGERDDALYTTTKSISDSAKNREKLGYCRYTIYTSYTLYSFDSGLRAGESGTRGGVESI